MTRMMTDWLAGSYGQPQQVRAEWRNRGVALIPIGRIFDAIRLPEPVVFAAVCNEGHDYAHADAALDESLGGPVIHDGHGRNYYAIVPAGTVSEWRFTGLGVECLGPGTHFGVPAVDVQEYDATHPIYWATLGGSSGFCAPASVALLVRIGAARLAEAEASQQGADARTLRTEQVPQ
ncbi:hypothetical protein ABZZ20_05370 [Streptomyces sp. NPDC006430]|uniref:hypothetical protein n=1 Tax=Streptomyces sp. NPDC006430 TaxID=3154299 RepID=UPI0033AD4970